MSVTVVFVDNQDPPQEAARTGFPDGAMVLCSDGCTKPVEDLVEGVDWIYAAGALRRVAQKIVS
jgi:hypothetical protein